MAVERRAELSEALRISSNHAEAHALNGEVRIDAGRWERPEEAAAAGAEPPFLTPA